MNDAPPSGYPVFLHLQGQRCLIVGAGRVALRKARGLLAAEALLSVVSPAFLPEFDALHAITRIISAYETAHMEAAAPRLVFAAADDPSVNARVAADAQARGIWCCRCDDADERAGLFSGAAAAHVGGIALAVSTGGGSAALAVTVRDIALAAIDPAWGHIAALMPAWRARVMAAIADPAARRRLLIALASDAMFAAAQAGNADAAFETLLRAAIPPDPPGEVQ